MKYRIGAYNIQAQRPLNEGQVGAILDLIKKPALTRSLGLAGRRATSTGEVEGLGEVVVKHYARGGALRGLLRSIYLRFGKVRSQIEFELMRRAREVGVNAPIPIAYVYKGSLLYHTWLITEKISSQESLAELSRTQEDRARLAMEKLIQQINLLIKHNIYHVDLHPGNILVTSSNEVYIVDFDKAYQCKNCSKGLRDRYIHRWRRAVLKHELPDFLSEMMCLGLRQRSAKEDLSSPVVVRT